MRAEPAVLFVCLGNICRSPLAEAAFRQQLQQAGLNWTVDSAGTGDWHIGKPPDRRAQAVARRHDVDISGYSARQVTVADFDRFSHILALDGSNLRDLQALQPASSQAELRLLLDYVDGRAGSAVADPYYGDDTGFDVTWADVEAGARGLMRHLRSAYA